MIILTFFIIMAYSGNIKTLYVDPVAADQTVCEFRLPNDIGVYPNLRILHLGVLRANRDTYSAMAGVYGKIRNISLRSNGQVIDELRRANAYLAFLNSLKDNNAQRDQLATEVKNNSALVVDSQLKTLVGRKTNPTKAVADGILGRQVALGYLPLNLCFPVLNEMSHLDTSVFKNLSVRIEYESRIPFTVEENHNVAFEVAPNPVLAADQIMDRDVLSKLTSALKGAVWSAVEHDSFIIESQSATADAGADDVQVVQTVNRKLVGYNDKYVSRILMIKNGTSAQNNSANASIGYGEYASKAQFKESVNFALNGKNVFSGKGLDNDATKLMILTDTYGAGAVAPFDHLLCCGLEDQNTATIGARTILAGDLRTEGKRPLEANPDGTANSQNQKTGQYSYIGCALESRVKDLQVDYERTCLKDSQANKPVSGQLNVNIYAEVRKQLQIMGDKFLVSYA